MDKSTSFSNKNMAQISTYQSGIAQSAAHRILNRITSDFLLQYGLTSMQWFIIGFIYDAGSNGIRISSLSKKLDTTLPYVTNTVNLLESKGFVRKISHAGDSRIKLVSIVPEKNHMIAEIEDGLRNHLRTILYREDGVTRGELQDYITVLYKIIQNGRI